MAYNNLNYLKKVKKVCDVFQEHYVEGITTQIGVFREYIEPYFFISEQTFRSYLAEPSVNKRIKDLEEGIISTGKRTKGYSYEEYHSRDPQQLNLF